LNAPFSPVASFQLQYPRDTNARSPVPKLVTFFTWQPWYKCDKMPYLVIGHNVAIATYWTIDFEKNV
jgi:hypothetical protein